MYSSTEDTIWSIVNNQVIWCIKSTTVSNAQLSRNLTIHATYSNNVSNNHLFKEKKQNKTKHCNKSSLYKAGGKYFQTFKLKPIPSCLKKYSVNVFIKNTSKPHKDHYFFKKYLGLLLQNSPSQIVLFSYKKVYIVYSPVPSSGKSTNWSQKWNP